MCLEFVQWRRLTISIGLAGGQKGKRLLVMLVGAPGSGKSTFCENVMRASNRPWVRVCQVFSLELNLSLSRSRAPT